MSINHNTVQNASAHSRRIEDYNMLSNIIPRGCSMLTSFDSAVVGLIDLFAVLIEDAFAIDFLSCSCKTLYRSVLVDYALRRLCMDSYVSCIPFLVSHDDPINDLDPAKSTLSSRILQLF